jgi:outer membrane lipoprotein-sorting protein
MVIRRLFLSAAALGIIVSASVPCRAAPVGVTITPPLASAKTIQVTETIWEAQNGATPGPLRKAGVMTFCIVRPDKFRVEMKSGSPAKVTSSYISDGNTLIGYDGGQTRTQPAQRAEWPFPVMGLLNNAPGTVSAVAAVRGGRQVLLAVSKQGPSRREFWFDPKTHLLLRDMMFLTWQGKTTEVMRTEYENWALNKPLPPSVFHVPSAAANQSHYKSS